MADIIIRKGDFVMEVDLCNMLKMVADLPDVTVLPTSADVDVIEREVVPAPCVDETAKPVEEPKKTRKRRTKAEIEAARAAEAEACKDATDDEPDVYIGDPVVAAPEPEPEAEAEDVVAAEEASDDVPKNIDELKTYFLSNSFDLNKLPELLNNKYGVKGVGSLADSQVKGFYEDLQKIKL